MTCIKLKPYFLLASLIFFLASLYFPAFGCNYFGADSFQYKIETGFMLFIAGWMGVLVFNFSWLANITYIAAMFCLLFDKYIWGWRLSVATFLLGLSSLTLAFYNEITIGLYTGFYLWMLSFAVQLIWVAMAKQSKERS